MKLYARLEEGVVAEIIELDESVKIEESFHPTLAKQIVPVTAKTKPAIGAQFNGGMKFAAPRAGSGVPTDVDSLLDETKSAKIRTLNSYFEDSLLSGFTSSALGSPNVYMSRTSDIQKLQMAVMVASDPNLAADWTTVLATKIEDANEPNKRINMQRVTITKSVVLVPHTATQIRQVSADYLLFTEEMNDALEARVAEVKAATTREEVNNIIWPYELDLWY